MSDRSAPRQRRASRPVAASWRALGETGQRAIVEHIMGGRYGVYGCLRRAEWRAERRPDLAAKALRKAAALMACVRMLGYASDGVNEQIDALAAKLGLEIER